MNTLISYIDISKFHLVIMSSNPFTIVFQLPKVFYGFQTRDALLQSIFIIPKVHLIHINRKAFYHGIDFIFTAFLYQTIAFTLGFQ